MYLHLRRHALARRHRRGAAHGLARAIVEARTEAELRRRALQALAELVPADVLTGPRRARHGRRPPRGDPGRGRAARRVRGTVGDAADHPLLSAHAARRRPALRLSEAVEPRRLSHSELYGDLLHRSGVEYEIAIGMRTGRGEAVVAGLGRSEREFSERDRDVLDIVRPGLEDALRTAEARGRLARALVANPPPGTAVVLLDRYGEIELSSLDAERWLAERFGAAEHPGWLPGPVARWPRAAPAARQCARPPAPHRPPLARRAARAAARGGGRELPRGCARPPRPDPARDRGTARGGRDGGRGGDRSGAVPQPARGPGAARALEAKLGVRTAADAVARALRESA